MTITLGRNEPCHCGSGKKYKKCHLEKDENADRKEREKAALNAAKVMAEAAKEAEAAAKKEGAKAPGAEHKGGWVKKVASKVGFFRNTSSQRRAPPANKGG
jgi:hypothetical protein